MVKQIFVNLPVRDLEKSMDFFKKIGFSFNKQFTDEKAGCLVLNETIYAMLLTENFFKGFTNKNIADTSLSTEGIQALAVESRDEVDEIFRKAKTAGAKPTRSQEYGYMYSQGFEDLDGHMWEFFWMDPNHVEKK